MAKAPVSPKSQTHATKRENSRVAGAGAKPNGNFGHTHATKKVSARSPGIGTATGARLNAKVHGATPKKVA